MDRALLCADIGTSSLKAGVITEKGTAVSSCRVRFPEGQYTAEIWFSALCRAAELLLADIRKTGTAVRVDGIVISGNGPTVVAADKSAEDMPSRRLGESLARFPLEKNIRSTGGGEKIPSTLLLWNEQPSCIPRDTGASGPSLFLPRLRLLRDCFTDAWDSAFAVFSGPEYLIWMLTGTAVTILPERRFTPAYWTPEDLAAEGIGEEKLPDFVPPGFCAGKLTAGAAELLHVQKDTAVYCGAPDFIAALIGTNTLYPGSVCDRAGTSEGINMCTAVPLTGEHIRTLPSVIPGLYNAGCLLPASGTEFSAWKKRSACASLPYEQCIRLLLDGPHDSEGFLLMERIAFQVRQAVETLQKAAEENAGAAGYGFGPVRLSGGQACNGLWNQMKADVMGVVLETTALSDAELTGDAVLGFTGMGYFSSAAEGAAALVRTLRTFTPDRKAQQFYGPRYERYLNGTGHTG